MIYCKCTRMTLRGRRNVIVMLSPGKARENWGCYFVRWYVKWVGGGGVGGVGKPSVMLGDTQIVCTVPEDGAISAI